MFLLKIAPIFLLALTVAAEKKIELQDIEEDNLRSEKEKQYEKSEGQQQGYGASAPGLVPLDYLKNNFVQYFNPTQAPQQNRYVHQYAVTEQPERPPVTPKPQYGTPTQQAMVGYLSNVPMQIYLVPQYYNEPTEQAAHPRPEVQLPAPAVTQVSYQEPQNVQQHTGYIQVPTYVTPTSKTYLQPYNAPVSYYSYTQPTIAPAQASVTPVLAYQMPVVHYPTAISAPPPKDYYQSHQYIDTNSVDESQNNDLNNPKSYPSHFEEPLPKPSGSGYPRYYNSRTPIRDEYRHPIELPSPSPLLLKAPPAHLAHIPKALPFYRPSTKPVYQTGGGYISSTFTPRPNENYAIPLKRRPTSLLDSYIPSSIQIEYMKRGYTKDSLSAYEALSSGRHLSQLPQSSVIPRHYERGFLPNQMYHTAAGGITYGHHKRAPKLDKVSQK
ncbi:altered inheritance of mitochondria protein 3-like [Vanessa atalanta]|uniref:altered inheritance of mitochondria protein 3-like n=1 Tax=Vanessa atalanta TaxID=42275 RepID=UPI001FCCECAD|nr:altered inheritance of mitochondria protein 3-like [Vanessa atalanta]